MQTEAEVSEDRKNKLFSFSSVAQFAMHQLWLTKRAEEMKEQKARGNPFNVHQSSMSLVPPHQVR